MKEVTLEQLKSMAQHDYYAIWNKAKGLNRDVKIYVHWTAGRYNQLFDDYHINITGDGRVYITNDLTETKNATFMRNTGSIAIGLCCALDAQNSDDLDYPPTDAQMNAVAQVICVLADALDLTIDLQRVMTHAEAAHNSDGMHTHADYGPYSGDLDTRWDLLVVEQGAEDWSGGDYIRGAANWWRGQGLLKG